MVVDTKDIAYEAANALADVKGKDITLLDFEGSSSYTDYFVIASGDSFVHMKAMANRVRETMSKKGIRIAHTEGKVGANWMLLDYQNVIVHIFTKQARDYYNIDELWGDAKVTVWDEHGFPHEQLRGSNGTFNA